VNIHITLECVVLEFSDIVLRNKFDHIGTKSFYAALGCRTLYRKLPIIDITFEGLAQARSMKGVCAL
jgi:hypothetical protein